MRTVKALFAQKRDAHIDALINDPSSREQLLQQAGQQLPDCGEILWHYPHEQVIALAMSSGIAKADESLYVGYIVDHHMTNIEDILPQVTKHRGTALAERCFVSLSFFRDYMKRRTERYGAPSPEFYMGWGVHEFRKAGWETLADHFSEWNDFWRQQFALVNVGD